MSGHIEFRGHRITVELEYAVEPQHFTPIPKLRYRLTDNPIQLLPDSLRITVKVSKYPGYPAEVTDLVADLRGMRVLTSGKPGSQQLHNTYYVRGMLMTPEAQIPQWVLDYANRALDAVEEKVTDLKLD